MVGRGYSSMDSFSSIELSRQSKTSSLGDSKLACSKLTLFDLSRGIVRVRRMELSPGGPPVGVTLLPSSILFEEDISTLDSRLLTILGWKGSFFTFVPVPLCAELTVISFSKFSHCEREVSPRVIVAFCYRRTCLQRGNHTYLSLRRCPDLLKID